jgi:hypothetical protein
MSKIKFIKNRKKSVKAIGCYVVQLSAKYFDISKPNSLAELIFPVSKDGEMETCQIIIYNQSKDLVSKFTETDKNKIKKLFDVYTDQSSLSLL